MSTKTLNERNTTNRRGRPVVHSRVYEEIRNYIKNNQLPSGYLLPTMADIGEKCNASRTVVRKALLKLQSEKIVDIRPGKGIYVFDEKYTPVIRKQRALTISFVTPAIDDPLPVAVHAGLREIIERQSGRLLVESADWSLNRELDIIRQLQHTNIDGAIILPTSGDSLKEEIRTLILHGFPIVLVDRMFEGIESSFVGADNYQGAKLAVEYLLSLGHRKIGMIKPLDSSGARERYKGYCDALSSAGIEVNEDYLVQLQPPKNDIEPHMGGLLEMTHLLELDDRPTAVFAGNDHLALGAIWAVQKSSLRVPEDISIIGFDALGVERMVPGGITTVSQPGKNIGKEAANLLMEQIKKNRDNNPSCIRQIRMPGELVLGATTSYPHK